MKQTKEIKKSGIISMIFGLLIIGFFFQNSIQIFFTPFNYFDEIVSLLFLGIYLIQILKEEKILSIDLIFFAISTFCIFLGLYGNHISHAQSNFVFVIADIVSTFRFIYIYMGLKTLFNLTLNKKLMYTQIFYWLGLVLKLYVSIVFAFAILNLFININMSFDTRFGLRSFAFVFGTPGLVINQMTYALIFFTTYKKIISKKVNFYIGITLIIILLTLRARALLLVVGYFGMYFATVWTRSRHMKIKALIGGATLTLLGYSQFRYYFLLSDLTPRRRFVDGAIQLMRTYKPFGSGFATFGSSAAAQSYSEIYNVLGFTYLRGMGPMDQLFLNDNYFPMIFGQLGIIGAIFFLVLLYLFARDFLRNYFMNRNATSRVISGFIILDIFLSSVQSSYLAHYSVVALIFIGLFCLNALKNKNEIVGR